MARESRSDEAARHEVHMKRMLHYRERHSGWHIFNALYWGIYLFVVGAILVFQTTLNYTLTLTAGVSLILLAVMVVVYGFVKSLHLKLMKKYG